jgi:hypothetical protein
MASVLGVPGKGQKSVTQRQDLLQGMKDSGALSDLVQKLRKAQQNPKGRQFADNAKSKKNASKQESVSVDRGSFGNHERVANIRQRVQRDVRNHPGRHGKYVSKPKKHKHRIDPGGPVKGHPGAYYVRG